MVKQADLVLVTDIHGDHLNPGSIAPVGGVPVVDLRPSRSRWGQGCCAG